jgi:hypothetical protein
LGQEFFINSQQLEDKVRSLLPSQGGAGAGFDLSASTQIIPIIDLTESAEGSNLRQDLQTALSFTDITPFNVNNATTTILNNTGYFRIFGNASMKAGTPNSNAQIYLTDGVSNKIIVEFSMPLASASSWTITPFDFTVFLGAGDLLVMTNNNAGIFMTGCTRQIASIDGTLTDPT